MDRVAIIERKDVEHIARLARLALSEEEKELIQRQLETILEYAAILNEVDTEGVEPSAHVVALTNVLRPDERRPSMPKEKALANAPEARDGYFYVPRILDE
ncbi:MAG TPA: Asp-tRNA(Asn)/Glu-tRNA(Gln) amidotransferase subunit GatC [Limnochordia bacterium]|nr:Asp-tRNA(Asn)/Glu-tRNA(Gln) amidotransferase subunit GatC [Limnochordia bacterium]